MKPASGLGRGCCLVVQQSSRTTPESGGGRLPELPASGQDALRDALQSALPTALHVGDLQISAQRPRWSAKELRRQKAWLQQDVERALLGSPGAAFRLIRDAFVGGWPLSALERPLQRVLRALDPQQAEEGLRLCLQLLVYSEECLSEASLSALVALLVDAGEVTAAEAVIQHALSTRRVKMRTLQPLLNVLLERGAGSHLEQAFRNVLRPAVSGRHARLNGTAISTLLRGFHGRPQMQDEVLTLLKDFELELSGSCLEKIHAGLNHGPSCGLDAEFVLPPSQKLFPRPLESHVQHARQRAGALLGPDTFQRLRVALQDAGRGPATCLVDGPNIGYRGAVQRRQELEGGRQRAGAKNFSTGDDVVVENLHAAYFRHDQIEVAMQMLCQRGEVPLLVMPERYAFVAGPPMAETVFRGPRAPLHPLVRTWFSRQCLFVVPDDEPDDAVWIFATLPDESDHTMRFAVTRDKAMNHRASIWNMNVGSGRCQDMQLERSFRRWRALYLRWYAISWDSCNHFHDVAVRIDETPPQSVEVHRHDESWYIPEANGPRWLQISRGGKQGVPRGWAEGGPAPIRV